MYIHREFTILTFRVLRPWLVKMEFTGTRSSLHLFYLHCTIQDFKCDYLFQFIQVIIPCYVWNHDIQKQEKNLSLNLICYSNGRTDAQV